jgi:plasmid stabilization system protein ParE
VNIARSPDFLDDVERQFEWYAVNANWEVAELYLVAVEAACRLVGQYPSLGPVGGFSHPRLRDWRFFVVFRPFQRHLLFYEVALERVIFRRALHGHRNLPKRLIESPGSL